MFTWIPNIDAVIAGVSALMVTVPVAVNPLYVDVTIAVPAAAPVRTFPATVAFASTVRIAEPVRSCVELSLNVPVVVKL